MNAIRKVVIIGPESTGKSTLSAALAAAFNTNWSPEFARDYLEQLKRNYHEADLWEMAKGQLALEQKMAQTANRLLFCDTDLYVIKVWSEAKYGRCDRRILEEIARRKYDFYLLTDIDIPWQPDPLREHPETKDRQYFYRQYLDLVQQSNTPFVRISGDQVTRLNVAISAVQSLL